MSCTQTLKGLSKDCAASMGGIKNAWIANFEDVVSVTVTDNQIATITMGDDGATPPVPYKFKKYAFRRGTGNFASTLNVDAAAGVNYVSTEIVLQFSRMETAKRLEMAALALGELALIVEDSNGNFWYFGFDEPVSASAGDGQTGTARTDGNRYQITLQDNSQSWPYMIKDSSVISGIVDTL